MAILAGIAFFCVTVAMWLTVDGQQLPPSIPHISLLTVLILTVVPIVPVALLLKQAVGISGIWTIKTPTITLAGSLFAFFLSIHFLTTFAAERLAKGCGPIKYPRVCHFDPTAKRIVPDFGALHDATGFLLVTYAVAPAIIVTLLIYNSPHLLAGWVAMTTSHPANHSITRAASHSRPTSVHVELDRIMRGQEIDFARAHSLIFQMNPLQQFIAKARYGKQIREAERLNQLVTERMKTMKADSKLYNDTIDMEIKKRGRR